VVVPGASAYSSYSATQDHPLPVSETQATACKACHVANNAPLNVQNCSKCHPDPYPPAPVDTTAPVITITGANPASVTVGSTYVDAGATANDAVDGVVAVTAVSTVDTKVVGSYTVTYSATDKAGNKATAVRTVKVVAAAGDTTAPVITITGANPASVTVGSTYVDAGATAKDAVDGTVAVTAVSTVDTSVVGSNTVTYSATDKAGNKATAVRTVNVVAAPSPDENATITFVVTDKTGEPIREAEVELGDKTTKTNDDGMAIFANVVPGSYEYEIEEDEYEEIEGKISIIGDQIVTVELVSEEEEEHDEEHDEEESHGDKRFGRRN